ncbi:MAG TPA: DNA-processing protein DprA [Chloroflexia bacterium]|nr:DNA-processing protein DprA [Chloroflexia bacterium]
MSTHILNPDTQAVLLLCGRLGQLKNIGIKPLTEGEYNALAEWLRNHDMRPSDLLTDEGLARLQDAGLALPANFTRLKSLLERGGALALAVEGWTNKGLWVISRSDEKYPRRLRAGRLGPPILYGVGNKDLLSLGGLAIVGSREVDEEALDFTRRVAQACASQRIPVVSGGARGVDIEAMMAAVERGGTAVGVLADSLLKSAVAGKYRSALVEESLVLISTYDPNAGFDVGSAMGRNKYVYGLADWALIVNSSVEKGGTWGGAVEALKSGKKPVFVRAQGNVPEGNRKLLEKGAIPFPAEPWDDLAEKLSRTGPSQPTGRVFQEQMLIEEVQAGYSPSGSAGESTTREEPTPPASPSDSMPVESVYAAVLPIILSHLHQPHDAKSLAQLLDVRPAQLLDWLDRAVQEGRIARKGRPMRYIVAPPSFDLDAAE